MVGKIARISTTHAPARQAILPTPTSAREIRSPGDKARPIRPAGRLLHVPDAGEIALERREQRRLGAALGRLAEERAARCQHLGGIRNSAAASASAGGVIGLAVADRVRRHVGEHQVGRSAEQRLDRIGRAPGSRKSRCRNCTPASGAVKGGRSPPPAPCPGAPVTGGNIWLGPEVDHPARPA